MLQKIFRSVTVASKRTQILAIFATLATIGLQAPMTPAQERTSTPSSAATRSTPQSDATVVFRSARDFITDGEWARARERFSEYVSSFPNEKNLDAALYWLAYSQNKLSQYDQSRATLELLLVKYPSTSWKDDARLLMAQMPRFMTARGLATAQAAAELRSGSVDDLVARIAPTSPVAISSISGSAWPATTWNLEGSGNVDDDDPCEFKIVVLQALFQTDVQRGIMAATDWLKPGSTQTVRCKSAALTLLGRHGGKAITPVILGVARNEADVKLRARAISALGATNDDSVIDALRDFALNSQENDIVEASLYALSKHTGERAIGVLSDIAINSKLGAQRKIAIANIASRPGEPAVDALLRIYDTETGLDIRKAVISGFANRKSERAGNKLLEIARGSDNLDLRKAAISAISRRGGDKAVEFLLSLYDSEKSEELKDQIINSLGYGSGVYFVSSGGSGLGLGSGSGSGSGSVQSFGYSTTSRIDDQRVISKLIEVARDQKAPMERRKRAIGWLSRSKDPKVLEFLQELLK